MLPRPWAEIQQLESKTLVEKVSRELQRQATEMKALEDALAVARAAPMAHGLAVAKHLASIKCSEVAQSMGVASHTAPGAGVGTLPDHTPRQIVEPVGLSGGEVVVERQRRFVDRTMLFRVEDCALHGGIRVRATDAATLAQTHMDVLDRDVQCMFDRWTALKEEANAAADIVEAGKRDGHEIQLTEFLCDLLDAAYFELDPRGTELELKLPAVVEPSSRRPKPPNQQPRPELPLSKEWIQEVILGGRQRPGLIPRSARGRPRSASATWQPGYRAYKVDSNAFTGRCDRAVFRSRPQSARGSSKSAVRSRPQSAVPSRPQSAAGAVESGRKYVPSAVTSLTVDSLSYTDCFLDSVRANQ